MERRCHCKMCFLILEAPLAAHRKHLALFKFEQGDLSQLKETYFQHSENFRLTSKQLLKDKEQLFFSEEALLKEKDQMVITSFHSPSSKGQ